MNADKKQEKAMDVRNQVIKILEQEYFLEDIKDDYHLIEDLGFDDIDIIEFIMTLEKEFNIAIQEEQYPEWENPTVSFVVDQVIALLG